MAITIQEVYLIIEELRIANKNLFEENQQLQVAVKELKEKLEKMEVPNHPKIGSIEVKK